MIFPEATTPGTPPAALAAACAFGVYSASDAGSSTSLSVTIYAFGLACACSPSTAAAPSAAPASTASAILYFVFMTLSSLQLDQHQTACRDSAVKRLTNAYDESSATSRRSGSECLPMASPLPVRPEWRFRHGPFQGSSQGLYATSRSRNR